MRQALPTLAAACGCLLLSLLAGCSTAFHIPSLPERLTPVLYDTHFSLDDGYVLPVSIWRPTAEPKAVILALHGFNDYRNAFAGVGPYFAEHGIITYAYDQRGFGATVLPGRWPGVARLRKDLAAAAALVRARHPDLPLYVLGESMGGAVAMTAGAGHQLAGVRGLILSAPAVWDRASMNPLMRAGLWAMANLMPFLHVTGEGLKIKPSDNRDMLIALGRDPLVIKRTRFDAISGLSDLMDAAAEAAAALTQDALILYGKHDEIIPKAPFYRMLKRLPRGPAQHWQAMLYPSGYHMLTRDLGARVVLNDIVAWVNDPGVTLPSGHCLGRSPAVGMETTLSNCCSQLAQAENSMRRLALTSNNSSTK
jgi:alpha-beta hydrolase superfamily lysophospholipase